VSSKDWLRFWALGIIWGTSFLWIKIAVADVTPVVLVGWRTGIATLGLAAVLALNPAARLSRAELRRSLWVFAILGLTNVALPFVLISWSEQFLDSGLAAILNSTMPLFTIIIAPLVLADDPFTLPKLGGLLVGFSGVVVLISPDLQTGGQSLVAVGTMLLASLSYAGSTVLVRRTARHLPSQSQAFLQTGVAALYMWMLILVTRPAAVLPSRPITWLALLWLGLLGSCLAYLLQFVLLHSVGPTRASLVTYVMPLVAVVLGVIFLNEHLYWQALVGGAMILSGIAVVNLNWARLKPVRGVSRDG
jgi:drug/metabolite transporter (DMT)-like permease